MLGYKRQLPKPLRACDCMELWVVIFLAGFMVGNVDGRTIEPNWQVEIIDSVAHARNAQDFYEALLIAEHGDKNITTIFVDDDFAIRGDAWSPTIIISKNLTIIGGRPNVQICVSKSSVIMKIQQCHVVVKGFTFIPVDSQYEHYSGKRQSEPAWFELDEEATVDFVDMVLEVASIFKLTNRPVQLSYSNPGFVSNVKEVDEAVIFVEVAMPPVTFTNVYFQHKDFLVRETEYEMDPISLTAKSQWDFLQVLHTIEEKTPHHITIQLDSDIEICATDETQDLVAMSKVVTITQNKDANLFLEVQTDPSIRSGLVDLLPEGQLHFEGGVVHIRSHGTPLTQKNLQSYFPLVNYPYAHMGPRCLVSFKRSFVMFESCADMSEVKGLIERAYVEETVDAEGTDINVRSLVGSGICMENVSISCSSGSLDKFHVKRSKMNFGLALSPSGKPDTKKTSTDKSLLYVLIVLIVLVLVTLIAFAAIVGNSRRNSFRFPKSRSRHGSGEKSLKPNTQHTSITMPTDDDVTSCSSYRVITCSDPTTEAGAPETQSQESCFAHMEPSKWTPAMGLTGMDEEEVVMVEKCVGHGGYGVVYKGEWKGQVVAVKTLSFDQSSIAFGTECPRRQRAILEAGIGSIVNHPNIVQTYSYTFESGDRVPLQSDKPRQLKMHMIQEFCEMGSLRMAMDEGQLLCRESNRPDLRFIVQIAQDVAKGMSYLHERNIIHGDLSAKNILLQTMVNSECSVIAKICDFGLSVKLRAADSHLQNCKAGTPLYMAPEVGKFGILSKKADIYSFGVVLWEAYKCSYKSWGKSTMDGCVNFPLECPLRLALLICWCLSPHPSSRPDFDEVLEVLTSLFGQATGPKPNDRKEKKQNRKIAAITDVWSSHQIREFLLDGSKLSCDFAPERLPTPRDNHTEVCLSIQIVKLNHCERLSMTWHEYNQRACASQKLQLSLISKCQSASIEGMESLPQDKKTFVSHAHLTSRDLDHQRPSLYRSRSANFSADAEDLVAKVEWLAEADSKGLGASDNSSRHTASRRFGNNSADCMSSQWRSASVCVAESGVFPAHDTEDRIGTGV